MINGRKILSIITARANSQGVKGKNFRMINGRPLVQWSILSSISCPLVDLTVVSSNCEYVKKATEDMIAEASCSLMGYGKVEFIQRPDELATSTSKNEDALIHAYYYAKENFNIDADILVNLQPTSPIRDGIISQDISLVEQCIISFNRWKSDTLFTASRQTPFFFKIIADEKGDRKLVPYGWDIQNRKMRQELKDLDVFWHDDGNVYVMSTKHLLETKCRLGGKMNMVEIYQRQSLQIDTELDFKIVELAMKERN